MSRVTTRPFSEEMHNPAEVEHSFRLKPNAHSGASRTSIPIDAEH